MIELIQVTINGALIGLIYGLVALSFVVIYRASRIINLAQGEVLVVGALLIWTFTFGLELPLHIGLPLSLVACVTLGFVLERLIFRPLIGQPAFTVFMASVALLILLRGLAQAVWGADTRGFPEIVPSGAIEVGPLLINTELLIGGILTLVLTQAMHWYFMNTRQGLRLAAVAEDHSTALSLGISVRRAVAIAWVLGVVLAAAGAVALLSGSVLSLNAAEIGFVALPVALLGGLESVRGAPLAGVIVGVGESLASAYLDPVTNGVTSQVLPYVVMIGVLLIRPQGLFGWKVIERL